MLGKTLSHYKVLEKIGQGGMGEVYRAEDTNLSREVAIKVLPEQFTKDPQRLARFEREAKLLASLNHPNTRTQVIVRAGNRVEWNDPLQQPAHGQRARHNHLVAF